jgi:hypothetical protein
MEVNFESFRLFFATRYPDLDHMNVCLEKLGEAISNGGLEGIGRPVMFGVTGEGRVAKGALEILTKLPHQVLTPRELGPLMEENRRGNTAEKFSHDKIYIVQLRLQDLVIEKQTGRFLSEQDYFDNPSQVRPNVDNVWFQCGQCLVPMWI